LELLGLIAAGLSNQEIAQRLCITLPTVKWHTGNIYGKLGVRSRTQAVVRARSLGILPSP
jgi:LuxR family maltose regulon positive regulatory protein